MPYLFILGCIGLVVSFNQRLLDPLTPLVAREIGVDPSLIIMLAPAFTLPYALGQPFLGPLGDSFGKARLLKICIVVLTIATVLAAFTQNYETLFACRLISGLAAGGVIPTSIAIIADRYPVEERQVAMSRFMISLIVGQLFAAPVSAAIAQAVGWHAVLLVAAAMAVVGYILTSVTIKPRPGQVRPVFSVSGSLATYRALLADPRARACYTGVCAEGLFVFGFTPHIALYLQERGLGAVTEAGYVLAGLGLGGIVFSFVVKVMVKRFDPYRIMQTGGAFMAGGLALLPLLPSWQGMVAAFGVLGFGFYMLHSGLQAQVTEVMPEKRASAVSLHAFFLFLGIAAGPVVLGFFEKYIGFGPTLEINAVLMLVVSFLAVRVLANEARRRKTSSSLQ